MKIKQTGIIDRAGLNTTPRRFTASSTRQQPLDVRNFGQGGKVHSRYKIELKTHIGGTIGGYSALHIRRIHFIRAGVTVQGAVNKHTGRLRLGDLIGKQIGNRQLSLSEFLCK